MYRNVRFRKSFLSLFLKLINNLNLSFTIAITINYNLKYFEVYVMMQ